MLEQYGDEAKPLAGGQSLLPMMNFRLARPSVLVDLERVAGLDAMAVDNAGLRIGAMARQAHVAASPEVRGKLPLLIEALRHVGHHQVRTRGTIGGSLAHGDPAAELPAVALLLDARIEARGPDERRTIPTAAFWQGPYTTALEDTEILTGVYFPDPMPTAWSFHEIARRGGDFAVAGLAGAVVTGAVRLVGFGVGWAPVRLLAAEAAMAGARGDVAIEAAAAAAAAEIEPVSDVHADASYRREAMATLVRRSLRELTI